MGLGDEAGARPRVLVVDDDPLILAVAKRVLDRAGYAVVVYEDAESALADLREQPAFALVADLNMPGMTGIELLQRVAQRAPRTRRLLYTGESHANEHSLVPELAHAIVSKMAGPRALPDALDVLQKLEP